MTAAMDLSKGQEPFPVCRRMPHLQDINDSMKNDADGSINNRVDNGCIYNFNISAGKKRMKFSDVPPEKRRTAAMKRWRGTEIICGPEKRG